MRMIRNGALAAGAMMAVGFLGACSDSATGPTSRDAFVPKSSFAVVGDPTTVAPPLATELRVCKAGDVGGTFTIANVEAGIGGTGNPTIIDQNAGTAGNQLSLSPAAGGAANCIIAAIDQGDAQLNKGDFLTVTEALAPGVTTVRTCYLNNGDAVADACPADGHFFINTAHGWTVVFTNTAPPPPPSCTYTKGWYRNHGKDEITGADNLSLEVEAAIFAATPGKPGSVTWTGSNDVLNLYQQYLAAIENGGLTGPASVQAAIAKVDAASSVTGFAISTSLTQAEVSAAINTLSSFNEGSFANYPHCD
jgi:hypothetical protein